MPNSNEANACLFVTYCYALAVQAGAFGFRQKKAGATNFPTGTTSSPVEAVVKTGANIF